MKLSRPSLQDSDIANFVKNNPQTEKLKKKKMGGGMNNENKKNYRILKKGANSEYVWKNCNNNEKNN